MLARELKYSPLVYLTAASLSISIGGYGTAYAGERNDISIQNPSVVSLKQLELLLAAKIPTGSDFIVKISVCISPVNCGPVH